jgi:hypothetical protein
MTRRVQYCAEKRALATAFLEAIHEFHRLRTAQVRVLVVGGVLPQPSPELDAAWERRQFAKMALLQHLLSHKSCECL